MAHKTTSESVVRRRLATLRRALPAAGRGDAEALHQARVASRRLREVLPLVAGTGKKQRKVKRRVRQLTRLLGPVRELDVALENLRELSQEPGVSRTAIARVRQALLTERRQAQAAMRTGIGERDIEKLKRLAMRAVRKGPDGEADDRKARLAAAQENAGARARRLSNAIRHAGGIYLPDRLHDVRIAVKKLRYAMEAVAEFRRSRSSAGVGRLRQTQDLLGRLHDCEVLIAKTRGIQGLPGAADLRRSAALDDLVRHLEGNCRQLHARYNGMRGGLQELCDRAERQVKVREQRRRSA